MLASKTIVVTGGTGAIGSAICRCVVRHGARLAFTWNSNEAGAAQLAQELSTPAGPVLHDSVGATNAAAIDAFIGRVEKDFGRIDALINNLGATQVMPFALIDEVDWDEMMNVNLKSMFLFSKAVVRGMIRQRAGAILNLGSIAGHRLLEVPVHYATAKAGVMGFTTSLAKELSRYGIRVNAVVPGLVEGGIGANVSERQLADYNRFCSLGRTAKPDEVAELAAFLVSERASYINAQMMTVDGGL